MTTFYKADCLQKMKELPTDSIDFIYFNPPFATTQQWWDCELPWKEIFTECFRLLKKFGTLAIHCSVPFNYKLIREAPVPPKYSWYWNKKAVTTPLLANRQPLRQVEEILVWYKSPRYFAQRVGNEPRELKGHNLNNGYVNPVAKPSETRTVFGKYQTHLIEMPRHIRGFATRPDELIELMIKSYTEPGDKVLDPTCYEGLSGVICKRLDREWIGIDKHFFPVLLMK